MLMACLGMSAQTEVKPWKCVLEHAETGAKLHLDIYEETVDVPGMDMLGPMNGYMGGGKLYGLWMTTAAEVVDERTARLRLSNDLGSETQECLLRLANDSTVVMELRGSTVLKMREGKKLTKLSKTLMLNLVRRGK